MFDISDKTIAALLDSLAAAKGDQITFICDSCHSGSVTRAPQEPSAPRVRRVPADGRIPPADLDAELRAKAGLARRGTGPSGWASAKLPYVLLAGCRDREESNEYEGKAGEARVWHGALTFFTLQVLGELPAGATYAELHERVAALVNAQYRNQMPQCEGDRDRQIFGNARVHRDQFIPVLSIDAAAKVVTFAVGLVHGLRAGTKLAVYTSEVRTRADLPSTPLATVEVTSVGATTALATVEGTPAQPIPLLARGRQTVRLEVPQGNHEAEKAIANLRHAIEHASENDSPSPYLKLKDDPKALADLQVKVESGQFCIYDPDDVLLVEPTPIRPLQAGSGESPSVEVCRALESIVRFRTIMNLSNDDPGSRLAGKVRLKLRRYVVDSAGPRAEDVPEEATDPGGELTLYFDPDHNERNIYVVDVINELERYVYPHVFTLSPDFSICRLHPQAGIQEAVQPNTAQNPFPIGLQKGTDQLRYWLPPGWDFSRDYLKLIVTTEAADLHRLEQQPMKVPAPPRTRKGIQPSVLQQILDATAFGERTRHSSRIGALTGEDWTVTQLAINTARDYQTTTLGPRQGRIALSDEVVLVKPKGFTGRITVTTLGLATRGVDGDFGLRPPPGLERFPDLFQSIGRTGTRSIGPTDVVIPLDADETSRRMITPENPLLLELPTTRAGDAADLIPVIFDGEDYLLAGYGAESGDTVNIVDLPSSTGAGKPTARGIARTLRLFMYKKLGRHTHDIGLPNAELRHDEVVYNPVRRDQFKPDQRVALFIHGFTSDTRWMIRSTVQFLPSEVCQYNHLLTWDYETFGTSIEDNSKQLALALQQQCGFGLNDQITLDLYTHSMGTLIARCAIELYGAHAFIDRLVLAGPPNRGSTLATVGRGFVFLITTLLNCAPPVTIRGTANWTLRQLYEQGAGVRGSRRGLATLNQAQRPDRPLERPLPRAGRGEFAGCGGAEPPQQAGTQDTG